MSHLARKLRLTDYFTLAWGTMVGVGWLVVMDDWLLRGGALGALLGFAIGGALLFPIGWVYGRLVAAMPDAAGEIAYTAAAFSRPVSFSAGWMMMLAYFIVCPWEAVAVGRIAGYIVPALDSLEIYRIAGRPVYLPHLVIGLGLTALLTTLNYRGIRLSATFQNWTAFGTLALFIVFVALGVSKGSPRNFPPLFTHAPLVSFLLMIQIVPYFMTGFESVSKAAEESTPEFRSQSFLKAIWMAILVGILFYTIVIAAVAFVAPWHDLTGEKFMTAVAFQRAARLALDRQRYPCGRATVAVQMLQRKFRSRQPAAVCSGTSRHGRCTRRHYPRSAPDAVSSRSVHRASHSRVHASGRCNPGADHRSRLRCLCDRMGSNLCRLPFMTRANTARPARLFRQSNGSSLA